MAQTFAIGNSVNDKKAKAFGEEILDFATAELDEDALKSAPWFVGLAENNTYVLIQPTTVTEEDRPNTLVIKSDKEIGELHVGGLEADKLISILSNHNCSFTNENIGLIRLDKVEVH